MDGRQSGRGCSDMIGDSCFLNESSPRQVAQAVRVFSGLDPGAVERPQSGQDTGRGFSRLAANRPVVAIRARRALSVASHTCTWYRYGTLAPVGLRFGDPQYNTALSVVGGRLEEQAEPD
jgi:hypothetical protein